MQCRFKEKVAGSSQGLNPEVETRRFTEFHPVPSSACWSCLHMYLEPGKEMNCNPSKNRKMDQVLAPEGMVDSESALGAFWSMIQPVNLKECLGPKILIL